MSGIVYVDDDSQLVFCGSGGNDWRRLTHPMDGVHPSGWQLHQSTAGWSWPCPSPSGEFVAAFHQPGGPGSNAQLRVVHLNGVSEVQLLDMRGSLPVYCQWNGDGSHIGLLFQDGEGLQLQSCEPKHIGTAREIEQGAPLFFQWVQGDARVLVHVGDGPRESRVVIRSLGHGEDVILGQSAGVYAAPQVIGERVWLSLPSHRGMRAVCMDVESTDIVFSYELEGLAQVIPAPQGPWVALQGLGQTGARGLRCLSSEEGRLIDICSSTVHSVDWLPDGNRLVVSAERVEGVGLEWMLIDLENHSQRTLCLFWPTPDELMRLRFSSQFGRSHPRLNRDGSSLCFASFGDPGRPDSEPGQSYIYELELEQPGEAPHILDKGSLAVYIHGMNTGVDNASV